MFLKSYVAFANIHNSLKPKGELFLFVGQIINTMGFSIPVKVFASVTV